jgi:hypothetical protein
MARYSKRPRVTNPARLADRYASPGERIIEFYDDIAQGGGLISFRRIDGNDERATLRVEVYRFEDVVDVANARPLAMLEEAERIVGKIRAAMDELRATADDLEARTIHPAHAANRIRKIVNRVSAAPPAQARDCEVSDLESKP